jgi:hypothetical protein
MGRDRAGNYVALPMGGNGLTFVSMSDPDRPKPLPARPPAHPPQSDTPRLAGPAEPAPATPRDEPLGEPPEEVGVSWRGITWVARVLGRSGRVEARSAPLMLVGFWERGPEADEAPAMESTVPGRRLADLSEETLRAALARAKPPLAAGQRRPFFEDADPTRRSGPGSEY